MSRTGLCIALICFASLLVGCGKRGETEAVAPSAEAKGTGTLAVQPKANQMQFISIEAVSASKNVEALSVPGRVTFRPQAQSAIGATTAGRVAAVLVQAGQIVKAGTPLVALESADAAAARAALDQANIRLGVTENAFRRQVEMVDKGVGLEIERQESEARLKEARAEQERAQHAADLIGTGKGIRVTVRAPVDGVVMAIRTAVGAAAVPGGEPLLELGDPRQLQVVAQVVESDLQRIVVGQSAEVEFPALASRVPARVESFNPRFDSESHRIQVYLVLARPIAGLRAGMLAQVTLEVGASEGISVPITAILIKGGKRRVVYVEKSGGKFEEREVQTGRSRDGRIAILQGLTAGEKVVVRGALLLDTQAELLL